MLKVRSFIRTHFLAARQHGWIPYFRAAAEHYDFPPAYLMAIASRETNMQNIRGDFRGGIYHGYGVMQVDIGTDPAWCRAGKWKSVDEAIMHGTSILDSKRRELLPHKKQFANDHDFMWTLAASYNHGTHGSMGDYIVRGNPDLHTTGHDYGADVVGRWREFEQLLAAEPEEPKEIEFDHAPAPRGEEEGRESDAAPVPQQPQQPVPQPMPQTIAAKSDESAVVTVPQAIPAQDTQPTLQQRAEKTAAQVKAWYVAIPAAVIQFLVAMYKWATDPSHIVVVLALFVGVMLVVTVFIIMNFRHSAAKSAREDEAAKRDFELKMQREKQAHELTILQAKSAASKEQNTVVIAPQPLQNSDS